VVAVAAPRGDGARLTEVILIVRRSRLDTVASLVAGIPCQSVSEDRAELFQDQCQIALRASITSARSLRIRAVTHRLDSASSNG
jgi:hypothetical protein